jgi:hypothetical protein
VRPRPQDPPRRLEGHPRAHRGLATGAGPALGTEVGPTKRPASVPAGAGGRS